MSYPAPFHRIVLIGSIYGDIFNTTLSMVPGISGSLPVATQALADAVKAGVAGWWNDALSTTQGGGLALSAASVLTSVKVNRIGTDGRYEDPEAIESVLTTPVPGSVAIRPPAQLSIVATLRGPAPRDHAGKGRMYFPPSSIASDLATDGRLTTTQASSYAWGALTLLAILNDVYLAQSINAVAGISSKVGSGAFQAVTDVTVGRTVDTMRSRRNKIPEDFELVSF